MITYHSWVLKDSWTVENGCRFIFSNTPENVHLIDITLPCIIDDLVQSVISKKWTVSELTQYLNQLANNYQA
jgi:hypothetical protein